MKKNILVILIIIIIIIILLVLGCIIYSNKEILYINNIDNRYRIQTGEYSVNYSIKNDGSIYSTDTSQKMRKLTDIELENLKNNLLMLKSKISSYNIIELDKSYEGSYIEIDKKRYSKDQFSSYIDIIELYNKIMKQVEQRYH